MSFVGRDSRATRRLLSAAIALAMGALVAGCGEKEEPEVQTPTSTTPTVPTATAPAAPAAPGTPTTPAP